MGGNVIPAIITILDSGSGGSFLFIFPEMPRRLYKTGFVGAERPLSSVNHTL